MSSLTFVIVCAANLRSLNDGGVSLLIVTPGSSNAVLNDRVFVPTSTVARFSMSIESLSAVARSDMVEWVVQRLQLLNSIESFNVGSR